MGARDRGTRIGESGGQSLGTGSQESRLRFRSARRRIARTFVRPGSTGWVARLSRAGTGSQASLGAPYSRVPPDRSTPRRSIEGRGPPRREREAQVSSSANAHPARGCEHCGPVRSASYSGQDRVEGAIAKQPLSRLSRGTLIRGSRPKPRLRVADWGRGCPGAGARPAEGTRLFSSRPYAAPVIGRRVPNPILPESSTVLDPVSRAKVEGQ